VSDGHSSRKLPLPIEVDSKEEYKLKEILQSAYRYNLFCFWVKYKRYSTEESKLLLVENFRNTPNMVLEFHAVHSN
jgi:hypothetical protein